MENLVSKAPINVHNTVYVNKVTPIELCGKTVMWQLSLDGIYSVPFEIPPTVGKHDFNSCPTCQETIVQLTTEFTERFNGKGDKKGFPFCCTQHEKLTRIKEFDRSDFQNVPHQVAKKVIFTIQHFINVADDSDWVKKCCDYLDWVIMSFGQMPNRCGEPFLLTAFFFHVEVLLKRNTNIPDSNKPIIQTYLSGLQKTDSKPTTDINILAKTYEKWIEIFPFDLNTYFGSLKQTFTEKLLFLENSPEVNMYSGLARSKMHTKESLIEALITLTNKLLTEINGLSLYEKGLITDTNKLKLELIINDRRLKLKQGYNSISTDEDTRYRRMIKQWFKDEKQFIEELIPLVKTPLSVPQVSVQKKLGVNQIALIHVYEGHQITRENANEIAEKWGYTSATSGEGLFQDYINYCSPSNRKGKPVMCTPKKLKNKIKLFESVIEHLSPDSKKRAKDEIAILKTIFEHEYE